MIRVAPLTGEALDAALDDVAKLRIEVFRAWPYLYDGDLDYERNYLESYRKSEGAVVVGAFDGTRFEREDWGIAPGEGLRVFDTALGRIGILICYDSEFPLLGRALAEAGVELLLVPSCTEALEGYWRVRIGAMARALENQCVAVMSSIVGVEPRLFAVEENTGKGGIFGPPDKGFPPTGVIAEGTLNHPGWTYAEVDPAHIREVRADGHVLNLSHWPEQLPRLAVRETKL